MTHTYPAFEALGTAPDYLWIGAVAIRALGGTQPQPSRVTRRHVKNDARTFASRYVGVTRVQGCYVAQWRNERGTYSRGPRRPDTPDGELRAAQDYAAATGRAVEERETPRVTSQDGPGRAERAGSAG